MVTIRSHDTREHRANRAQWIALFGLLLCFVAFRQPALAQAGYEDDRVMLQGFYWDSPRHGHPEKFTALGSTAWYDIVKQQADRIRAARFDLIWLPPPSHASQYSAGYDPRELYRLDNSYGSFTQHRALLLALLQDGIEPVADIVINHRNGSTKWADFTDPTWDTRAICADDEAFSNPASEVVGTPVNMRGAAEEPTTEYAPQRQHTYAYGAFRDVDHTNPQVHHDIVRYLLQLKSMGYRGWRYDMVHGYHARWIRYYNRLTQPTFSVGEYDWGIQDEQRGWVWYTATATAASGDERLRTASSVFDFSTYFTLKDNKGAGHYGAWYGLGNGIGLIGDTTDGLAWKNRAVTFVETTTRATARTRTARPRTGMPLTASPTRGKSNKRTRRSSPTLACRASTGSISSIGAPTCRERSRP